MLKKAIDYEQCGCGNSAIHFYQEDQTWCPRCHCTEDLPDSQFKNTDDGRKFFEALPENFPKAFENE